MYIYICISIKVYMYISLSLSRALSLHPHTYTSIYTSIIHMFVYIYIYQCLSVVGATAKCIRIGFRVQGLGLKLEHEVCEYASAPNVHPSLHPFLPLALQLALSLSQRAAPPTGAARQNKHFGVTAAHGSSGLVFSV